MVKFNNFFVLLCKKFHTIIEKIAFKLGDKRGTYLVAGV